MPNVKATETTLLGITIFKDLDIESRKRLAESIQTHSYQAKQVIIWHKENTDDVYFLVQGSVRATIYSPSGKEVSFEDPKEGEMFGELAAIDGRERSTHVVANCDSLVASMSKDDFLNAVHTYPAVADAAMGRLSFMVRRLCERIFEFSTLGVKNRIHAELLRLARDAGIEDGRAVIKNAPIQEEIANRISTHREAVNRELKVLSKAEIIDWHGSTHVIENVPALQKMVDEVRGPS